MIIRFLRCNLISIIVSSGNLSTRDTSVYCQETFVLYEITSKKAHYTVKVWKNTFYSVDMYSIFYYTNIIDIRAEVLMTDIYHSEGSVPAVWMMRKFWASIMKLLRFSRNRLFHVWCVVCRRSHILSSSHTWWMKVTFRVTPEFHSRTQATLLTILHIVHCRLQSWSYLWKIWKRRGTSTLESYGTLKQFVKTLS